MVLYKFQFHKGTIRTNQQESSHVDQQHFNSIKVQLELASTCLKTTHSVFQFHKGTIRTNFHQGIIWSMRQFQFHKGTIRTLKSVLL